MKILFAIAVGATCTNSLIFQCRFTQNGPNWSGSIQNLYTCTATVNRTGEENVLEDVTGLHNFERNNFDVESLDVSNQNLTRFPRNVGRFFPNLKLLRLFNASLTMISANDLQPFPNLLIFFVSRNNWMMFDDDLFKFTPKIWEIYFDDCSIRSTGRDLIRWLWNLRLADFRNNNCISVRAASPLAIRDLRQQLLDQCPPTDPQPPIEPLPTHCPEGCAERFESLENQIDELVQVNEINEKRISELERIMSEQRCE